jgi:DNA-binding response OmpR family regulator
MPKRILVVDDEPRVLKMLRCRLETAGYQVSTAVEGHEALQKVRDEKPDLIVLDLILPGMSGYEVCARLKGDEEFRRIPVLVLSARSQEQDAAEGKRVGADAFMTKPYDGDVLLARVSELLTSWSSGLDRNERGEECAGEKSEDK